MASSRIFITAAEVSGDRHAAQLVRSLREIEPGAIVEGLGGPEMESAGALVHRNTVTRAAMGIRGVLRAGEVYKILRWTRGHFDRTRPDLWIGVDSPSMNFHFAKAAHDRGIPTLQYVAPQLWAWAPWRMKKVRRWIDRLACILPFEEAYFREHGVNADFVGHPLFDELPADRDVRPAPAPGRPPVVGLLPGSRRSEAQGNFPGLLGAARLIRQAFPDACFLVPTTAATHPVARRLIEARCPGWAGGGAIAEARPGPIEPGPRSLLYGQDRFDDMVRQCDLCLTVSGTATLHVAAFSAPMIVVYRVSRAAWNLAGRWLVPTRTFALVNVLASRRDGAASDGAASGGAVSGRGRVAREFVPWYGDPEPVANAAIELLRDPDALRARTEALRDLVHGLDRPGASRRVAELALGLVRQNRAGPVALNVR